MATVGQQIQSANKAICDNIKSLSADRPLLSQNLLSQARNLVEGVAVLVHTGDLDHEFSYEAVSPALSHAASGNKSINFLNRFHNLLLQSASHYTLNGDMSERLMLKYYEYFIRIRTLLLTSYKIKALSNLEDFPVDLDPALREYHEKIAERIDAYRSNPTEGSRSRYYIFGIHPFFVRGRIFYEVTFQNASDRNAKFDRVIGFTDIDMTDKYAANLTLKSDVISVIGHSMPIIIISDWAVSIRPCELNNFSKIFGESTNIDSGQSEYRALMNYLTETSTGLLDVVRLSNNDFSELKSTVLEKTRTSPRFIPILERARMLIASNGDGSNMIRYLMLRMNNVIIKGQYNPQACDLLSGLCLDRRCKPFDSMPFCTSPRRHNPRISDLLECLDAQSLIHELLARKIKTNVEQESRLYTPLAELERFEDIDSLVAKYNNALWFGHRHRRSIVKDKEHLFIREYEDDTYSIIVELQKHASGGLDGYDTAADRWTQETALNLDDPTKIEALKKLYTKSQVALIYGAAGTGKTRMIEYVADMFADKNILFLAHTNPAINNLVRRVKVQNGTYKTITSHNNSGDNSEYDILVVDECSIVGNADFLAVLNGTSFRLLLLVGDVYQLEPIEFGNWFALVPSFLPKSSIFELTEPYRTKNPNLLNLWNAVRKIDGNIAEIIAQNSYSAKLDESLFVTQQQDEIILCLNYDGLYGINNINRFLQGANQSKPVSWGVATYKVGDPILFNDSDRFRGVIYNNLKGTIVAINKIPEKIVFDIEIDRIVTELDTYGTDLEWVEGSVVRFPVYKRTSSDEDDDSSNTNVPFQVAYAVSIHKAQGLEYDSVKIVITDANEDDITHSIFYTAITRARKDLKILWSPEVQQSILQKLNRPNSKKDAGILSARRKLQLR
ncbi:MAG: AAA family ATPase [Candidatus Doudnabacteria bacterium]|nr:AAA family ATPase [Candidatus Doudnabacteria bacterium]